MWIRRMRLSIFMTVKIKNAVPSLVIHPYQGPERRHCFPLQGIKTY